MPPKISVKVNKPKSKEKTVKGATIDEVRKNLNKMPEWGLYDATKNVKTDAKAQGDTVTEFTLTLNPTIELPKWAGYSKASKDDKAKWDKMIKALKAHEDEHHNIQVKAAADLEKTLKGMKGLTVKQVQGEVAKGQAAAEKAQKDFDTSTKHGTNKGVQL